MVVQWLRIHPTEKKKEEEEEFTLQCMGYRFNPWLGN